MAVIRMTLPSHAMHVQTAVTIVLPTEDAAQPHPQKTICVPGMQYQVLWLLHGGGGNEEDFLHFSNVVRYADESRTAVVMPCGYTAPYEGDAFTYITQELPALLRMLLPLSPRREDNFIGGLSTGGDAALRACLCFPERYAAGLIMSAGGVKHVWDQHLPDAQAVPVLQAPAVGGLFAEDFRFDVLGLARSACASGKTLPQLIFASGSGDHGYPAYRPVMDALAEIGVPQRRCYTEGDGHSWNFWDSTLHSALRELLPLRHDMLWPEEMQPNEQEGSHGTGNPGL
jgi:putative tributyrin esterase